MEQGVDCGGLSGNIPHRLRCLNTRSPAGRFRRFGLPGESMSLEAGLRSLKTHTLACSLCVLLLPKV